MINYVAVDLIFAFMVLSSFSVQGPLHMAATVLTVAYKQIGHDRLHSNNNKKQGIDRCIRTAKLPFISIT